MLRQDLRHANDAQAHMLSGGDKAAAAWWTYKPPPQVAAVLPASQMPHAMEGAGRWVPAPAVRHVDTELQSHKQSSPRCARADADSLASLTARSFRRRDWSSALLPPELSSPSSMAGNSLNLPSMDGKMPVTTEPTVHADGSSPLGLSPHRRGRNTFAAIAPDFSGRYVAPGLPVASGESMHSMNDWMAAQHVPAPPPRCNGRTTFAERLHAEGMSSSPTPFTDHPNLSPRKGMTGAFSEVSPAPTNRQHHSDLWPQSERVSHPRAGPVNGEAAIADSVSGPPGAGVGSMWGGEQLMGGNAGARDGSPTHRRVMTDLTKGYQTSGGITNWAEKSTYGMPDALTDTSYQPPQPGASAAKNDAPEAHRRGRSDLHYIISPRHERAEYAARERETATRFESHGYGRKTTVATVPQIEDVRRRKQMGSDHEMQHVALTSSDIHPGASAREWRLQQAAARRAGGMAG